MSLVKQFTIGLIWAMAILTAIFAGSAYLDRHFKVQMIIERV